VTNSPLTDDAEFKRTMKSIGDVQLQATLLRLAKGLPVFQVRCRSTALECHASLLRGW
jgi:hypothetical protein